MEYANPEETILAQAKVDLDCWSSGDTEGYGKSASDDVTYFNNVPATGRIDGIRAFRHFLSELKGVIPAHEYKIVEPKIQVYGDTGIFTLQYHAFTPEGETIARGRGTIVYYNTGEDWQMVHTHWSVLEDA